MPRKWEHDVAIKDLRKGDRVLEVGCGIGDFVARLVTEEGIDAMGIELNAAAVQHAQSQGRPVVLKSLEETAAEQPEGFDAVCCFQVLEHVPDPRSFITHCVNLLRPGGRLIIGVPNSGGFIRFDRNGLLNSPPHHVTRWRPDTFRKLPQYFPIELRRMRLEPLALYHLDWYANIQVSRLPRLPRGDYRLRRFLLERVTPFVKRRGWYKLLHGHTVYVCYEKTRSVEIPL